MSTTFRIDRPQGFRLAAAADFYAGFIPGSGMAAADARELTLAFHADETFASVAVALREEKRRIVGEIAGGADPAVVARQVARMLGLEEGCEAWTALGARDALVGRLQREFDGFYTAAKASPYDAATWAVIAPRLHMAHAARIKMAMARDLGGAVALRGRVHAVFPPPERLVNLRAFPGLPDEKVARLRAVAGAALAGKLDAGRLRQMGEHDALTELQSIRGVGPWAAAHIYFRGAAPRDGLSTVEPRVLHGFAHVMGGDVPSEACFRRVAESWRPFRMWVCVLLSRHLARTGGWRAPGLARERTEATKKLALRTGGGRSHAALPRNFAR